MKGEKFYLKTWSQGRKIDDDYGGLGLLLKKAFLFVGHGRKHDTDNCGFKQFLQPEQRRVLLTKETRMRKYKIYTQETHILFCIDISPAQFPRDSSRHKVSEEGRSRGYVNLSTEWES